MTRLDEIFGKLEKEKGKGVIIKENETPDIERIALRSPKLNDVLGGGMPLGRIVELYGVESGGKSLIATTIGGDFQRAGKFVVYIDVEGTFSYAFARKLGLDTSDDVFRLIRPESGEDAFDIIEAVLKTGEVGLIIVDSVSALTPTAELEGDMGQSHMGTQARLMGQGLRKINPYMSKSQTSIIFINQIRMKIGVMFGNPETTSGGRSLPFYASIRCDIRRIEDIKRGEEIVGLRARFKNVKNKTAPPKKKQEIDIYFDSGIDYFSEYIDFAISYSLLEKSGSWFTLPNGDRVQGRDKVVAALREDDEMFEGIRAQVMERMNPMREATADEVSSEGDTLQEEAV